MTTIHYEPPSENSTLSIATSHLKDVVHREVYEGLRPGHFLTCVITNDLFGAVARADENSAQ